MGPGKVHHRATVSAERSSVLALAHDGFVTGLSQSFLRERPGKGLHLRIPVDDPVVGVYHVDGVARAGLDQTPDCRRKLSHLPILIHLRPYCILTGDRSWRARDLIEVVEPDPEVLALPRCLLRGLTVKQEPSEPPAKGTSDGSRSAYSHPHLSGRGDHDPVLPGG